MFIINAPFKLIKLIEGKKIIWFRLTTETNYSIIKFKNSKEKDLFDSNLFMELCRNICFFIQ